MPRPEDLTHLLTRVWLLLGMWGRGSGAVGSVAKPLDFTSPGGGSHEGFGALGTPLGVGVPPDRHVEDLSRVVARLASELERFNTLYVIKLERELTSTASRLSALESAVRAVADRALAWDNIQNHMAVWTDQSRTMERKLDILNRCHEKHAEWDGKLNAVDALNHKLSALDNKINAMTRLEFKVEQVSERVEEVDSKVSWLQKQRGTAGEAPPPGGAWGEFTTRGVLTTLTSIEDNLKNLSKNLSSGGASSPSGPSGSGHSSGHSSGARGRSRVAGGRSRTVRHPHDSTRVVCDLDSTDSSLLQDVSAKVDLVFDRLTDTEDYDNLVAHFSRRSLPPTSARASTQRPTEHRPPAQPTDDRSAEEADAADAATERIFAQFWRSLFAPFKKLNRRFRALESHVTHLTRQCSDPDRGSTVTQAQLPNPSVASARPPLTPSQLKLAVAEAVRPIEEMVATNQLQASDEVKAIAEQLRSVEQTVDSSTFRFEEEASSTRELILNKHRGLSLALVHLQKTVDGLQCATKTNETALEFGPEEPASANYVPSWKLGILSSLDSTNGRTDHARLHRQSSHLVKNFRTTSLESETEATALPPPAPDDDDDPYLRAIFGGAPKGSGAPRGVSNASVSRAALVSKAGVQGTKSAEITSTESSPVLRLSKAKRSIGCHSVSTTGPTTLPGAAPQRRTVGMDYYVRYCDQTLPGGGWTVIQRRGPPKTKVLPDTYTPFNFTRSWEEYKRGFGRLDAEFWWGNENIHRLSQEQELELRFDLWDFEGNRAVAAYSSFSLANETSQYQLSVAGYHGNASDSFSAHDQFRFSTYDRDNDRAPDCCPCAPAYGGGWWFFSCFESNLNGEYHSDPRANDYYRGLIWELWTGDYSLYATQMSVRPAGRGRDPALPTG